jgi:ferric-dicitrate binding protein FerR (iron transport regulator)
MMTKELIWKFFRNECTAEEKEVVAQYLEENPGVLEEYLSEEDWELFETSGRLDPSISNRLSSRVKKAYGQQHVVGKFLTRLAAAACIILLAGIGWKVLLHRQTKTEAPALAQKVDDIGQTDSFLYAKNVTEEKMTIALSDGSLIELYPASEVRFHEKMKSRREIYLQGKAYFKVAPDINTPFVVYSNEIATTVLGTSFTVTSFETDNTIKVGLHTGKVLVRSRSADNVPVKLSAGMNLSPGELLVYDRKSRVAKILSPDRRPGSKTNKPNRTGLPEWYMFSGQSLEQVFDQLSVYYSVEIGYSPSDIRNRYFTARYENGDSLDTILEDIALLNQLSIIKQDGRYIVKKRIH